MRATSSAKSEGVSRSLRQDGGSTTNVFSSTSQPIKRKTRAISVGDISRPKILGINAGSKSIKGTYLGSPATTVATCFAELCAVKS